MKLVIPEDALKHLVVLGKTESKQCTRCKQSKALDKFGMNKRQNGTMWRRAECRQCEVDRSKEYRKTNAGRQSRSIEGKKRFAAMLTLYRMIKEQQKCLLCPESNVVCIDFHHLHPAEKRRALVDAIRCSFRRFIEEAAKCICLCANCHRKLHAKYVMLPPGTQPLSKDWLTACLEIARVKSGLPMQIKLR